VLLSFLKRFGIGETAWLVEWSFDQLFGWHQWAMEKRQILPSGLIAPGSDPILPLDASDWGVNTMQGARWETGMDNSPMYDGPDGASHNKSGPIYFNTTSHLMQLMDVGMTSNLAADMLALAELGAAWCETNGTAPSASACGPATRSKISWLRSTAATLGERTQAHLWNDEASAFVNKMPAAAYPALREDTFYTRISPTSFYPMMPGHATASQVARTVRAHLLNPTGFCVTPEDEWPPATPASEPGAVMLQSWHATQSSHELSLCRAEAGGSSGTTAPGGCAALEAAGGSFVRNESIGWADAAVGRAPLFLYRLPASNQTIVGTASSFPAKDRASPTPVCYLAEQSPQPGAYPLRLWSSDRLPSSSKTAPSPSALVLQYQISGGPASDEEIESSQDSQGPLWNLSSTLGYALPLPHACYWCAAREPNL
jgi:hypothetical protein